MAKKRMFDKRVVESDKFTDLPNSSKALYFLAGMSADDRGFFQPRMLQKMHGFTDDDFKILIAKRYFIPFESGVIVITDWNKNNWLDSRRVTETEYVEELKLLKLINEKYELASENDSAKQMLSQNSIDKNSIDKNSIDINNNNIYKEKDLKDIITLYEEEIGLMTPNNLTILESYLEEMNPDLIKESIKLASKYNKKNMAYIQGILKNWLNNGYETLADVQNDTKPKKETEEERKARKLKALEEATRNDIK